MFEIIVLFMMLLLFSACLYSPLINRLFVSTSRVAVVESRIPGEAHSFLGYLQKEIEAELFPRPTDSVLRRHYDALVAVEIEHRLALMTQ